MIIFNWAGALDVFFIALGIFCIDMSEGEPLARIGALFCFGLVVFWDFARRMSNADSNDAISLIWASISPGKGGMFFFIPTWGLSLVVGLKELVGRSV